MARKRKISKKKIIKALVSFIAIVILGIFSPEILDVISNEEFESYSDYPFCVSFIDVGQGDCSLISCNGINILVDGGESDCANGVINYLRKNGVEKLDCYIITHPHSDHMGAAATIINSINCDNVFTTYFSEFNIPTTRVYENFLDALYDSKATAVAVEAGDSYTFGDLELNIIAPFYESDDYNDMSIVFTATYFDSTVMFTGDTTKEVESQILKNGYDVNSDILKVAHHGSTTSNSANFIDAVSPDLAVISCGENNSYGHPHKEILELFDRKSIDVFRTDRDGTVICYGDGKIINTVTLK